jgi:hypothetical protein
VVITQEQKAARAAKRDLNKALEAEARAHRNEARRQRWIEESMYLTREEAAAGEPCRGCGLPVIDNLGSWPGTMFLTDEQRVEYDDAEARYREMHPDCESHRWSMAGSRTAHCGSCCPPLPIPEKHLDGLRQFLAALPPRREDVLVRWARTLTCGHIVDVNAHYSSGEPSLRTERCVQCKLTRGVITSERVVTAASRAAEARRHHAEDVARAECEVAKAERAALAAKRKLDALRAKS